jgi:hypothetical protein
MKPAWLIDEYAIMRFTSVCTTAITAPPMRVATATAYTMGCQFQASPAKPTTNTRSRPAKAPALTPDAM